MLLGAYTIPESERHHIELDHSNSGPRTHHFELDYFNSEPEMHTPSLISKEPYSYASTLESDPNHHNIKTQTLELNILLLMVIYDQCWK